MEGTAADYKTLYEASLLDLSTALKLLASREEQISQLQFELDKFRRYLFGQKNEKFPASQLGADQMGLFELGITQAQSEELSQKAVPQVPALASKPKKRAKGTGRMSLPENLRREIILIEPEEDVRGCAVIG